MTKLNIDHSDAAQFAHVERLKKLPDTVTGHSVMADGKYGGPHTFHRNKDKLEIHWPPNVVEPAPPKAKFGEAAYWNGSQWELRQEVALLSEPPEMEPIRSRDANGIAFPLDPPVKDERGFWPYHVLSEDGTEWVWKYPDEVCHNEG